MISYNIAILDDDILHAATLETQLCTYAKHSGILFHCHRFHAATAFLDAAMQNTFSLCILSMDLKEESYSYFSEQIYKLKLSIPMILSSHDTDRAYEAFRHDASGFLRMPIEYEDLSELLNRLLPLLYEKRAIPNCTNSILVKRDGNPFYILTHDIYYFEKYRNKLYIYTKASCYHIYETIKTLRHQLNPRQFIQIHQGCLINWNYVSRITPESVILGTYELPISKAYYKAVLFQLNMHPLQKQTGYLPADATAQVAQSAPALLTSSTMRS